MAKHTSPSTSCSAFFRAFQRYNTMACGTTSSSAYARSSCRGCHHHAGKQYLELGRAARQSRSFSTHAPIRSRAPAPASSNIGVRRRVQDRSDVHIHPDLATHLRHTMRRVPHPVVVITASAHASGESDGGDPSPEAAFRGMTISSFNTVTFTPKPYVSFNVKVPSSTYTAVTGSGSFLAHLLSSSAAGARVAAAFAGGAGAGGHAEAFRSLAAAGAGRGRQRGEQRAEQGTRILSGKGTNGAPLVVGPGVLTALRCRLLEDKQLVVGDHVVLVGEVLGIVGAPPGLERVREEGLDGADDEGGKGGAEGGNNGAGGGDGWGLVYGNRGYRRIGREIEVETDGDEVLKEEEKEEEEEVQKTMGLNLRRGDER